MLFLLATAQGASPWIELSLMGRDERLAQIWNQLSVSDGPVPSPMPVYRQIAARSGRMKDLMGLCATAPLPNPPDPLQNDPAFHQYLAGLKMAFRSLMATSAVEFYDGRAAVGTKMLRDGLQASYRMQSSSMLGGLSGIALQSMVLAEVEKRLGRFSLTDLEGFAKTAKGWLADKPLYLQAIERDRATSLASFDGWWRDPWPLLATNGMTPETVAAIRRQWETIPANAQAAEAGRIREKMDRDYRTLVDHFGAAESTWPKSDFAIAKGSEEGLASKLAPYLILGRDVVVYDAVPKGWTQLRLLRLHALVRAFRWRQDRWPRSLSEAAGNEAFDPIANKPFTYGLEGGAYRLRSEGWPSLGPIELRYRSGAKGEGTEAGA
ncbi:hypothetical protein EON79_06395 [bacterium]|nr:MAG: hypothetical protein EON79_06395 [bacterium]